MAVWKVKREREREKRRRRERRGREGRVATQRGGLPLSITSVTCFRMDTGDVDRSSLCFPSLAVGAQIVPVSHRGRAYRTSLSL